MIAEKPDNKFTSADLCRMIQNKFASDSSHLALFDVPDNVGTNAKRRADAIVIGNWGSTGRLVHGFEIKVSRGDWLKELKDTSKADPFIARCDRWWLCTADDKLAKLEEIPALWGWMTATKSGLRIQKPAMDLGQPKDTMHKLFALGLLRAAYERSSGEVMENPLVVARIEQIHKDHARNLDYQVSQQIKSIKRDLEEYKKQAEKFEADSGMELTDWKLGNVGKLAAAIAAMHGGGYSSMREQLKRQMETLRETAESIEAAIGALPEPEGATP
jgi:hypothetical protein